MVLRRFTRACRDVMRSARQLPLATHELAALREQLAAMRRDLESVKVHTWHAKESAWIAAHDAVILQADRYADPRCLTSHHAQMYSQNGEDGMIAEIFRRIGTTTRTFVEIGVGNGTENNSRFLLETGWRGVWIENDPEAVEQAHAKFGPEIREGRLRLVQARVTRDNAAELLREAEIAGALDFLSIDVDMNTAHLWRAVLAAGMRPRVSCIEYNASVPPSVDWEVPYDAEAQWQDATNRFGAGLKTLETIGRDHRHHLVGCDYLGANAFFVEEGLAEPHFLPPFSAERHYEPPRYTLLNHRGHLRHDR